MIDRTYGAHTKKETKMSWPIISYAIYGENQTGQWCDRSYRFGLYWNPIWNVGTYLTMLVYDANHIRKWQDQSYRGVYAENEIELPCVIGLGAICDEN